MPTYRLPMGDFNVDGTTLTLPDGRQVEVTLSEVAEIAAAADAYATATPSIPVESRLAAVEASVDALDSIILAVLS